MDDDGTRNGGRPQASRLCVRWGPSLRPPKRAEPPPQFLAHFYSGQTAGCIKMPLGMDVGLIPGDFVFDGDPVSLPKKGAPPLPKKGGGTPQIFGPCLFWPSGWMDQDATLHEGRSQPRRLSVRWGPSPHSPKRGPSTLPIFRPISIVAKRLHASKCHLV